jgi:hypothetical protein
MPAANHPGSLVETAKLRLARFSPRPLVVSSAQPAD